MLEALNALSKFLGTVLALAVVVLLSVAAWIGWKGYNSDRWELEENQAKVEKQEAQIADLTGELETQQQKLQLTTRDLDTSKKENEHLVRDVADKQQQIVSLNEDLAAKQAEIQRLAMAVQLLKVDHRVARIEVIGQQGSAEMDDLLTKFNFVEIDDDGRALEEPRVFTIRGDVVYIDAWVIKFTDDLIALPDPVRCTSFCQFRRLFGESQQPKEGYVLDAVGSRPMAYQTGGRMSELEQKIWAQFWQYANDPVKARKAGVRAVHGEAPSIKLMPGKSYKVLLRASDGLTIVTEEEPAASGGNAHGNVY